MKKEIIMAILIIVMVASSAVVIFSIPTRDTNSGENSYSNPFPKANHDVIRINSDADFNSDHGVVSGDGTLGTPYVISGWTIDGSGKGVGIYIGNTTKNFTIENCIIYSADGGNWDSYHQNAGIEIYNAKADYIHILNNTVYSNDGAGILFSHVSLTYSFYIGDYSDASKGNRIYDNGRAGIYIAYSGGGYVDKNMIFNNDVGIHLADDNDRDIDIRKNGIALNTYEGMRVTSSSRIYVTENIFYKNHGSTNRFDSSHPQATQYSSTVYWYSTSNNKGNFWYDWAESNETNYDDVKNYPSSFIIPWKYPILNTYDFSVVEDHDDKPLKGVHHDAVWLDWEKNNYDRAKTFNIGTGVIAGLGTTERPYIISGWEIDGTVSGYSDKGYGFVFNGPLSKWNGNSAEKISVFVDGMVIHNVTSVSSTDVMKEGQGLIINNTETGYEQYLFITNVSIYGCENSGILVMDDVPSKYYNRILNSYIHDNLVGITAMRYDVAPQIMVGNTTVDHNQHAGFYADSIEDFKLYNNIFSRNDIGVDIRASVDGGDIQYNSFYKNTRWGIYIRSTVDPTTNIDVINNIFYKNNGAGDTYDASYIQVYSDSQYVYFKNNVYYDWVNNNRSNDLNGDGIIDWSYKIDGSAGLVDSQPMKWVDFEYANFGSTGVTKKAVDIVGDDVNIAPYRGTKYGIIGGEGTSSEPYLILGWNITVTGDGSSGIYLKDLSKYFTMQYDRVYVGNGYGVYVSNMPSTIKIENSVFTNDYFTGIRAMNSPFLIIDYNIINGSLYGGGIYISDTSSGWIIVHHNSIYKNRYNNGDVAGIRVDNYDQSSSGWGLWIYNNQIFGNNNGTYVYSSSNVWIYDNGIAYNDNYGVVLKNSHGNHIYGNVFYRNYGYEKAYDDGDNDWNTTSGSHYGNFWYYWATENDTNDQNHDWFVDYPYEIGGGSNKDEHPYKLISHSPVRINNIGDLTWDNCVIAGDGSSAYPYTISGFRIDGSGKGYGLYLGNVSGETYFEIDYLRTNSSSGGDSTNEYYSNTGMIVYKFEGSNLYVDSLNSSDNEFSGIRVTNSWNVNIEYSKFFNNDYGVVVKYSHYTYIYDVNASYNAGPGYAGGIVISHSEYTTIDSVYVYNNPYGIILYYSTNGEIKDSVLKENLYYGAYVQSTSGFVIHGNQFIGNNGASEDGTYDSNHIQAYDDESTEYTNLWNTTTEGNCWSDWTQSTPYQLDPSPYIAKDRKPGCSFVPELYLYLPVVLFSLIAAVMIHRRKRDIKNGVQ